MKQCIKSILIPFLFILIGVVLLVSNEAIRGDFPLDQIWLPCFFLFLELIAYVGIKVYQAKEKRSCPYHREVKDLLPPSLAESIIDCKMETKELFNLVLVCILVISSLILNGIRYFHLYIYLIDALFIIIYFCRIKILTPYGKKEYRKILGLKKFMEDYSLLEDRHLKEVEVWDEYLVYATAFGISNHVTKYIPQNDINANYFLQVLDNMIGIH